MSDESNTPSSAGENFGAWLKAQREAKGLPLEEVATATKIHVAHLRALEENSEERFPPPAFLRGFLVSYARHVKLDETEVLSRFRSAFPQHGGPDESQLPKGTRAARSQTHPKVRLVNNTPVVREAPAARDLERPPSRFTQPRFIAGLLGGLLLLVTVGYLVKLGKNHLKQKQEAAAVAGSENNSTTPPTVTPPALAPSPTTAAPGGAVVATTVSTPGKTGQHKLEIRAIEQSWVNVRIDSGDSKGMQMKVGAIESFDVGSHAQLSLSNAGGVEIRWNGQWYQAPGFRGDVTSLLLPEQLASLKPKALVKAAAPKPAAPAGTAPSTPPTATP